MGNPLLNCLRLERVLWGIKRTQGVSGNSICAVRALLHYLHARGSGPLFRHQNGLPLTRTTLTLWLKNAVSRAGVEGNFSGHSFRIGAATSAATAGIPDHLIKTLGRWFSNAYQLYIKTPSHVLESVAERIVCNQEIC